MFLSLLTSNKLDGTADIFQWFVRVNPASSDQQFSKI